MLYSLRRNESVETPELAHSCARGCMTKILIVEDEPDVAELVRRVLASRGYEVYHAPTAELGLELALVELPDLILLDLGLPDYDGQTLAGWLRAEPSLDGTPLVAFTAWPSETVKAMTESYGCAGYISKPIVSINRFAEQIKSFLLPA
jgi:DNA-binding response OmpR family regulator